MHTVAAMRTGTVQSMRREVCEFVSLIGFETSMEDIIKKIEERFGECWTADRLPSRVLSNDSTERGKDSSIHRKVRNEV